MIARRRIERIGGRSLGTHSSGGRACDLARESALWWGTQAGRLPLVAAPAHRSISSTSIAPDRYADGLGGSRGVASTRRSPSRRAARPRFFALRRGERGSAMRSRPKPTGLILRYTEHKPALAATSAECSRFSASHARCFRALPLHGSRRPRCRHLSQAATRLVAR